MRAWAALLLLALASCRPSAPATPNEPCVATCLDREVARAEPWERIVADCRAECSRSE